MKLSWKIYSFGFALLIMLQVVYSLLPDSAPNVYYKILISFDKIFVWKYCFHFLNVFLDLFGLVPLLLFVFKKKWFAPIFWKIFFFVKIGAIFFGNYYETNLMGTIIAANKLLATASLITGLLVILPYYIAIFLYAFRRK